MSEQVVKVWRCKEPDCDYWSSGVHRTFPGRALHEVEEVSCLPLDLIKPLVAALEAVNGVAAQALDALQRHARGAGPRGGDLLPLLRAANEAANKRDVALAALPELKAQEGERSVAD